VPSTPGNYIIVVQGFLHLPPPGLSHINISLQTKDGKINDTTAMAELTRVLQEV